MTDLFDMDMNFGRSVPATRANRRANARADELDPKFIQLNLTFDTAHDDRDSRGSARRSHARGLVA